MEQQFVVERAENRVEIKITAMLIGRHGRLGVEKATAGNFHSSRRPRHLDQRMV